MEAWAVVRVALARVLSLSAVSKLEKPMARAATGIVDAVTCVAGRDEPINLEPHFGRYSMSVLCLLTYGVDLPPSQARFSGQLAALAHLEDRCRACMPRLNLPKVRKDC
jgi:cytochrome P450